MWARRFKPPVGFCGRIPSSFSSRYLIQSNDTSQDVIPLQSIETDSEMKEYLAEEGYFRIRPELSTYHQPASGSHNACIRVPYFQFNLELTIPSTQWLGVRHARGADATAAMCLYEEAYIGTRQALISFTSEVGADHH